MSRTSAFLIFTALAAPASCEYEWAGIFDTPDDWYLWTAQKVEGEYADPKMKLVAIAASESSADALQDLESTGKQALEGACVDLHAWGSIVPAADAPCYNLVFAEHHWQSLFKVSTANASAVAFFAEHVPTEFESTAHYLKDSKGEDVEPDAELPEAEAVEPPWGEGIGASLIVNVITLVGVIFLTPGINAALQRNEKTFRSLMSAFASGALLSAAVYLLLFEATHLIATSGQEESAVIFKWGTMILLGVICPTILDLLVPSHLRGDTTSDMSTDKYGTDKEMGAEVALEENTGRARVISAVLLGDFLHNLCDGIFMGTAFRYCNPAMAWNITLSTVLHEIAQELSDYVVLTNPAQGALKPWKALVLNFLSGLGVLIGTLVIFSVEAANDESVGMVLAFGGGVYVQIAAAECMPRMYEGVTLLAHRVMCVAVFILGCTAIGLVLIDHKHCAPGGHDHGH